MTHRPPIRQVAVVVPILEAELVSAALWSLGVLGIEEFDGSRADTGEPSGSVCLVATPADGDIDRLLAGCQGYPTTVVEVDADTYDGYLDAWRDHADPVWAGESVVLWPAWWPVPHADTAPDVMLVVLDPGRAFGSGSHPTTRLAASAVAARVEPGHVVIDVGCGSGVLSVVAAMRGAARVVAVDLDAEAVDATTANASRNGVGPIIAALRGSVADVDVEVAADVVVANITAGALVEMAGELMGRCRPGGVLILTGVLDERAGEVIAAFGIPVIEDAHDDGWALLVLAAG